MKKEPAPTTGCVPMAVHMDEGYIIYGSGVDDVPKYQGIFQRLMRVQSVSFDISEKINSETAMLWPTYVHFKNAKAGNRPTRVVPNNAIDEGCKIGWQNGELWKVVQGLYITSLATLRIGAGIFEPSNRQPALDGEMACSATGDIVSHESNDVTEA